MKFAIITHVIHGKNHEGYFAYEPYVREMNLWIKNVPELLIVAPLSSNSISPIQEIYQHKNVTFIAVDNFNITNLKNAINSVFVTPKIVWKIFLTMKKADHIHLRCPGNIGLIGCIVQIFFPSKPKTTKYAGNWEIGRAHV